MGVAHEEPGMQLYVSLCPIVNFASHVIQSRSDPDGFVKWVRPGWPRQNVTRMTRPSFNAGVHKCLCVCVYACICVYESSAEEAVHPPLTSIDNWCLLGKQGTVMGLQIPITLLDSAPSGFSPRKICMLSCDVSHDYHRLCNFCVGLFRCAASFKWASQWMSECFV